MADASDVVVVGGGIGGASLAFALARAGVDVTVLEADPAEPPGPVDAWSSWTRKGVAQFRQPHNLFGRFRQICDDELPELTDKLLAAGCVWVDFLETLPPRIDDRAPRPGDDRLRFVTGRRPVVFDDPARPVDTAVWSAERPAPGQTLAGPCLIELPGCCVVVPPGADAVTDETGDLLVSLAAAAERVARLADLGDDDDERTDPGEAG